MSGFGLAVHAASRPRDWLREVARSAPAPVVAMDDDAGMLLAPGAGVRTLGDGRVWVVDSENG